jgi:hypothetical protein
MEYRYTNPSPLMIPREVLSHWIMDNATHYKAFMLLLLHKCAEVLEDYDDDGRPYFTEENELVFTGRQLAMLMGVSRESAKRMLSKWNRKGLIQYKWSDDYASLRIVGLEYQDGKYYWNIPS